MVRKLVLLTTLVLSGCGPGPATISNGTLVSYGCKDSCYALLRNDWGSNTFSVQEILICKEDYSELVGKRVIVFRQPEGVSDEGCPRVYLNP